MSQDGTWQDREPHPGGEVFVPREPDLLRTFVENLERELRDARLTIASMTAQTPTALVAEIAKLRAELRAARLVIAAIVTQHGESLGDGRYRLVVDPAHLESAEARQLAVITEPNSGAMLLRVRPL